MSRNKQNENELSDELFSELSNLKRGKEQREAERKRVEATIRRQNIHYKPYFATSAAVVIIFVLILSIYPTFVMEDNQVTGGLPDTIDNKNITSVIKMKGSKLEEYYSTDASVYPNNRVLIATIYKHNEEIHYKGVDQRIFQDIPIYYELVEHKENQMYMAFTYDGFTYSIKHFLSKEHDEAEAFTLVEEFIEVLKNEK